MITPLLALTLTHLTSTAKVVSVETTSVFAGKLGHTVTYTATLERDGSRFTVKLPSFHDRFFPLPAKPEPGDLIRYDSLGYSILH